MKLALILMIKNESKILRRCLETLTNVVDCFCICDTGSTDNTQEIAKEFLETHEGCLTVSPFVDFGSTRTQSFLHAQTYLRTKNWNLRETYGLLLDADMVFVPNKVKEQNLTEAGYSIIQLNGGLEYYNCRLVRMDFDWKCIGVTHEYWGGASTAKLGKDICYIDDRNDGGCKHDKFERDKRLLEQGLVDDPTNVRYMFYLAQTYKCLGNFDDAIKMYVKRIEAGGWVEEIWYSHYMIGECYRTLKNIPQFEAWMELAHLCRSNRSETLYKLAEFHRIASNHYKAYHYIKLGEVIPFPKEDILFIEQNVYNNILFEYEKSIVEFYIHPERCLRTTIQYLLKSSEHQGNCIANLKHTVKPLRSTKISLNIPTVLEGFKPSAISLCEYPFANVRLINYRIEPNGGYTMPNGIVETKNAYLNLETMECVAKMEEPLVNFDTHIKGLEDLRLYKFQDKHYFTATSYKQFIQDKISIVHGEYDIATQTYKNYRGIESPLKSDCEKNWVNIPGTNEFIYSWSPLRIGTIQDNQFLFTKEIRDTPPLFKLFRGSAPPIEVNGRWLVLVHFVEYCQPRNYYHCFVELEKHSYKILKVSLPFVFEKIGIEFCISGRFIKETSELEYYFSSWDANPAKIRLSKDTLEWIELSRSSDPIVRVPSNLHTYWDGGYSRCLVNGSIEAYVKESIQKQNLNVSAIFSMSDGFVDKTEFNKMQKELGRPLHANTSESDFTNLELAANQTTQAIVCMLCSRSFNRPNALLLPLDDATFQYGLQRVLATIEKPNWEERYSIAFWRGGSSGLDRPESLRMKVTKALYKNPLTDVKITKWGNWENEKDIPEEHFGDRCGLDKHFRYKYILIVDGNLIASNHQWVFGSGAVPIMITHPNNNWWFKNLLKPMENYVPISYDLSDLEEKIQWLVDNDGKAKQIAEHAVKFSEEVFNPKFQQNYIDNELARISSLGIMPNSISKMQRLYLTNSTTPSDINEHLPTLLEYTKQCNSVVECGVREICSSYAFALGLKGTSNNCYTLVDPYKSNKIDGFLNLCKEEGINASFVEQSDLKCPLIETDLLFIDTWHIYGQLKRELAYWHSSVKKYIIMHDTTVDEWAGETIRSRSNGINEAKESGFPLEEIMRGLWPAIDEFLREHPEWKLEKRYTNNNGLTVLTRIN